MILEEIAAKTVERVKEERMNYPELLLRDRAEKLALKEISANGKFSYPFEKALAKEGISFICEVKRASPSKGMIAEDFPYLSIAEEYEEAGAAALSVLTEPYWFKGDNRYLAEIAEKVKVPVLRKDFTVCPYMVYEAKVLGAAAVLLICTILTNRELKTLIGICNSLGLSALVEAHTADEVRRAVSCGARIIGVNNRDLKDFTVDIGTAERLRTLVPDNILFVAESGIRTAADVDRLRAAGTDAVLIGETLMRSADRKRTLAELAGGAQ